MTETLNPLRGYTAPEAEITAQMRPDDGPHLLSYDAKSPVGDALLQLMGDESAAELIQKSFKDGYLRISELESAIRRLKIDAIGRLAIQQVLDDHEIEVFEITPVGAETIPHPIKEPELDQDKYVKPAIDHLLDQASKLQLLSSHQEKMLGLRVQKGDMEAKNLLVERNILLLAKYAGEFRGQGLSFEDLVMEGFVGLNRAAEKFDPHRGFRFSTYAVDWIKQSMQRAVLKYGNAIRLPAHVAARQRKLKAVENNIYKEEGIIADTERIFEESGLPNNQASQAWNAPEVTASLNLPIGEHGDGEYGDLFADDNSEEQFNTAVENERSEALNMALQTLSELERQVVEMRFGLRNKPELTAKDVGKLLHLDREAIQEIQADALKKLAGVYELANVVKDTDFVKSEQPNDDKKNSVAIEIKGEVKHFYYNQYRLMELMKSEGNLSYRNLAACMDLNPSTVKAMADNYNTGFYRKIGVSTKQDALDKLPEILPDSYL